MKIKINDNTDTVTCRICGEQCKRIYGKHLKFKHYNMTTKEYKKMFIGAPIMALSDKKNTTKIPESIWNKKNIKKCFQKKWKEIKNPNHKSKTTKLERKSRSPFSKDFIKYVDIENKKEHISLFVKESIKDRVSDTTLQYYLDRGYSLGESEILLKK